MSFSHALIRYSSRAARRFRRCFRRWSVRRAVHWPCSADKLAFWTNEMLPRYHCRAPKHRPPMTQTEVPLPPETSSFGHVPAGLRRLANLGTLLILTVHTEYILVYNKQCTSHNDTYHRHDPILVHADCQHGTNTVSAVSAVCNREINNWWQKDKERWH